MIIPSLNHNPWTPDRFDVGGFLKFHGLFLIVSTNISQARKKISHCYISHRDFFLDGFSSQPFLSPWWMYQTLGNKPWVTNGEGLKFWLTFWGVKTSHFFFGYFFWGYEKNPLKQHEPWNPDWLMTGSLEIDYTHCKPGQYNSLRIAILVFQGGEFHPLNFHQGKTYPSLNPKFPNPKSKLFRPDFGDFGFWFVM